VKLPPFWRGLSERASKSLLGGFVSYAGTAWLDHLVYLSTSEKAIVFAIGTALFSVVSSLISRPIGPKDSPSLVQEGAGTNRA
jgi:hypothetical protein